MLLTLYENVVNYLFLASALNCYLCIGSEESDCARGEISSFTTQTCSSNPGLVDKCVAFSFVGKKFYISSSILYFIFNTAFVQNLISCFF